MTSHSTSGKTAQQDALSGATVLVVEDDLEDAHLVLHEVSALGGRGLHADCVQSARALIVENTIDLIVLDRMLADGEDGLTLLSWFQELEAPAPAVLVASRLSTSDDHILGLELGADDYINKPFDPRELAARLKALMRRAAAARSPKSVQIWGDLEIRTLNKVALWKDEPISMRPQSFAAFSFLALHKGDYVSREALWRAVWDKYKNLPPQNTVINNEISRLRGSLNGLEGGPKIVSENLGYRLVIDD